MNRATWLAAALAGLLCVFAYAVALNGPLFFDDTPNITENRQLMIDGRSFDGWREAALSSDSGALRRPVAMLSFAVNHVLAGQFTPLSLKLTNLLVHLTIGCLVYIFCALVLRAPTLGGLGLDERQRRLVAVTTAAIWLVHPIQVSTVLYAVQRMAQLSALFTLLGLVTYLRYRLRWMAAPVQQGDAVGCALWLLVFSVLAVLSKENGALLPWLVLALEVSLFAGQWNGAYNRRLAITAWALFLVPLALVLLLLVADYGSFTHRFRGREFSFEERVLTQFRVLWTYVSWLTVPNILEMGFFHDDIPLSRGLFQPITTIIAIVAWIGALLAALLLRARFPLLLFVLLFFLTGHSMESSVLPLQIAFEHRNYLPGVAVLMLFSVLLVQGAARLEGMKTGIVCGLVVAVFVALLAVRTSMWRDEVSLARFNVVNHPDSPRANFFYANALYAQFVRAHELGLSEDLKQALAVASRDYFAGMYERDPRDFAALVMLYQLDTMFFPGLARDNDWLGVMESLATDRRLQSSDRTALGALSVFIAERGTDEEQQRLQAMLQVVIQRYPKRMDLVGHYFRFLHNTGQRKDPVLLAMLENALEKYPSRQAASYMAQFHGMDDLGATYEAMLEWQKQDTLRRELSVISRVFQN